MPIDNVLPAIEKSDITIVIASPLSDIAVEIPKLLHDSSFLKNNGSILVSNPREEKVKELTVRSSRGLKDGSSEIGHTVGFSLPFLSVTSSLTKIEYATDALVSYELAADPFLKARSALIIDDVHLRRKWTDVILSIVKNVARYRREQKIVNGFKTILCISQSCLQLVDQLVKFFLDNEGQPVVINVVELETSKSFGIDTYYLDSPTSNYLEKATETVLSLFEHFYFSETNKLQAGGDVLVFLPTRLDVNSVLKKASNEIHHLDSFKRLEEQPHIKFFAFHESLSVPELQELRSKDDLETSNVPIWRVIICTSLAENDFTLLESGRVMAVIDSGLEAVRFSLFNKQKTFLRPISQSKAEIRRGMAGNNMLGHVVSSKCFRIYRSDYYTKLPYNDDPELTVLAGFEDKPCVSNSLLADILIMLISIKIKNPLTQFDFLPPIPLSVTTSTDEFQGSFRASFLYLFFMECIDSDCGITEIGEIVAQLATIPINFSRSIISANNYGCLNEMVTITAMFLAGGISTIFVNPAKDERDNALNEHRKFQVCEGDALTLLNVYESYRQNGGASGNGTVKWAASKYLNYRALLRAEGIRTQILRQIENITFPIQSGKLDLKDKITERLCKCICEGFFLNIARKTVAPDATNYEHGRRENDTGIRYELVNEDNGTDHDITLVKAHDSSVGMIPDLTTESNWVIYTSMVEQRDSEWIIEGLTMVKKDWVMKSKFYQEKI